MPSHRKKGEMYKIEIAISKADYKLIDSIALVMNKLYPSKKTRVTRMVRCMLHDAIEAYKRAIEAAANPKLIIPSDKAKLEKNTGILAEELNRALVDAKYSLERRNGRQ